MSARPVPTRLSCGPRGPLSAGFAPSLSGLTLKPRRRVPIDADGDNNDEASSSKDQPTTYELFGSDSEGEVEAPAPAPAVLQDEDDGSDGDVPMPQAQPPAALTEEETVDAAMSHKRKMDELAAAAQEAKKRQKELTAELKEKRKRAQEEAAEARVAKAARAEADRLEREAEKERKKQEKEAEKAQKAAEKAAADEAKAAAAAAKAEAKAAEAEAKAQAKAEAEEAKAAAAAAKAEAKAAKDAAAAEAKEAKEAAAAEKRAEKEAAAAAKAAEKEAAEEAKAEAERQKAALKDAEAARKAAEAEEKRLAAEAKKAEREAAATAKAAKKAAEEAALKEAEALAEREKLEEECAELLEAIHRVRWEMRGLGEDFQNQLKAYDDLNCEEILNEKKERPKWMDALIPIFEAMSESMKQAEEADPVDWELEDADGYEGEHATYAKKFDQQNADGDEDEEPDDMDIVGKFKQGAANAEEEDEEVEWEPDTLQVDVKLLVRNVGDDTEKKELWRARLITHDYENRVKGDYVADGPDPNNPTKTLYKFVMREAKPYPPDIDPDYVAAYANEKTRIERAFKVLIPKMCSDCDPSVAESVAGGPLSAYEAAWVAQQNMELNVGQKQTYWNIGFQFPDRSEENQERARSTLEQMLGGNTELWSKLTGLVVVQISGVADKAGFLAAQSQMDAMVEKGFKLTKEENEYLEATEGKDWKVKLTPQNQLRAVKQVREMFEEMEKADRAKKGAASQRQIGLDDASMVQKADKGK